MLTGGRNKIHPEVQQVLDVFDNLNVPDFYKGTPDQARELFRSLRPDTDTLPAFSNREDISMSVDGADIALRVYRPDNSASLPVLLWFHGGGWVFGDLDSGELACRELATQSGCAIVSVDYRLAPENRFPVALDDCMAATRWVLENAATLGLAPDRVAVGGDSAGGNLAACVAQSARAEDIPLRQQLLVYPVTQPSFDSDSYRNNASGYFLSLESMQWFWDHYVPDHDQRNDPRVSPLFGGLHDLAPAWIFTCGFDPLCDDGLMYANALAQAGNEVSHYHRDDSIHGVFGMPIDPGAQARAQAAAVLAAAMK